MNTDKRLTQAYCNAKIVYIDENSKYILFSDAHRADNSLSDEFSKNQNIFLYALEYYFERNYVYIEAGDGDELWEHAKFKHIRFAYSDIFRLLKRFYKDDRLIILYGNHNLFLKNKNYLRKNFDQYYDEYNEVTVELFKGIEVNEAILLKCKTTGQEILTVHGHQGDFMNDQFWLVSMVMMRFFWRFMHLIGFQNPASPAKNVHKMHKIEKNYNKWIQKHKTMLICGHTHRAKYPRSDELPYFNTGCCVQNKGISGIEIVNGNILLVEWRIRTDTNGVLKIEKIILHGPQAIERFDISKHAIPFSK